MKKENLSPRYKSSVLDLISKKLFKQQRDENKITIYGIIRRLANHHEAKHFKHGFSYKGESFGNVLGTGSFRNLPKEFHEEFHQTYVEITKLDKDISVITAYLTRLLNLCTTQRDIAYVMPKEVHFCFLKQMGDIKESPLSIDESSFQLFLKDNEQYENLIRERLMLNLILEH